LKLNLKSLKRMKMLAVVLGMAAAGICYGCNSGREADRMEMVLEAESGEAQAAGLEDGSTAPADLNASRGEREAQSGSEGVEAEYRAAPEAGETPGDGAAADHGVPSGNGGKAAGDRAAAPGETSHPIYFVHVCGAVVNPGVYEMEPGSRIYEAVDLAGGFGPEAAWSYLNLAQEIADGMKIEVPTERQAEEWEKEGRAGVTAGPVSQGAAGGRESGSAKSAKVNLNTAGKEELMTLKGIGESKAEDIIRYRETYGPFERIEDIMNISGIKDAAFQKIKDSITV